MRTAALLLCTAAAAASYAQVTPLEFGAAYSRSASFTKTSGGTGTLIGPEFSISQTALNVPLLGEARYGASVFFGGGTSHGGDTDGTIYRIFARGKSGGVGGQGAYFISGAYYGFGSGRGGSFDNVSGAGLDVGFGLPLSFGHGVPGVPKSSIEFITHQSSEPQLRGWSLILTFRL